MAAVPEKKKTSMGMDENVAGLLSYLFGFITGLIFYIGEKENKFVRFHALQSIALSIVMVVLAILLAIVGFILAIIHLWFIGTIISAVVWIGVLVLWIFLMVRAFQGAKFKLPLIGDFCEKHV
jgi:uncharacterized membrane protein